MKSYSNVRRIRYAPTETADLYPESDGKPMADTDRHYKWIVWLRQVLERHFAQKPEVYISGNIMMYDIEGPLRTAVSPDILVSFGIGRKERRTYKVWEEGKPPDFVMEFSSRRTYRNDLDGKVAHYTTMGIQEYFLYDADRRYLPTPLMGFRLVEGVYIPVSPDIDGRLRSEVLNLDFYLRDIGLGIYDPDAMEWLQTPIEAVTARADQEKTRADQAETRADQEKTRADQAETRIEQVEAEAERLREELARLKAQ